MFTRAVIVFALFCVAAALIAAADQPMPARPSTPKIDEAEARAARTAQRLLAMMPRQAVAVVVVPSGRKLLASVDAKSPGMTVFDTPTLAQTMKQWRELCKTLGWSEAETIDRLAGGTCAMVWCRHPADATDAAPADAPVTWAFVADVSSDTEKRLRERMQASPRTVVQGQPVLTMDNGRYLMMTRRKGSAEDRRTRVMERPHWVVVSPVEAPSLIAGQAGAQDAGERVLLAIAPALNADVNAADQRQRTLAGLPVVDVIRADGVGEMTLLLRLGSWDQWMTATVESMTRQGATIRMRARAPEIAESVKTLRPTPDALFERLKRDEGFTMVDAAPPVRSGEGFRVGGVIPTAPWRRVFGDRAAQVGVVLVHPDDGVPVRDDGERNWRFIMAQRLAEGADTAACIADADAVMTKAVSIIETGRVMGPALGGATGLPDFTMFDHAVQRGVTAESQQASFYYRLFGPRAWAAWQTMPATPATEGCWTGTISTVGRGERESGGAAEARARKLADAALSDVQRKIEQALADEGPKRRWVTRGSVEFTPLRTAAGVMFSPTTPIGPALSAMSRLRWDVWADDQNDLRATLSIEGK